MERMLENRVAVVTGSGRGIGRAAAIRFAEEGAKVVVSDIDNEPADEVVSTIKASGGEAIACVGDVTDPKFPEKIVGSAVDAWGGVHILVNNAGYTWDSLVHKMSDEQWDAMLDVHLKAPFRIIRAAAPYFRRAAKAEMAEGNPIARKIINISSIAGTGGNLGQANYSSAKAGILGLTKTLSKEWARYNVQANAVAFGFIETRLTGNKEAGVSIERSGKEVAMGIPEAQRNIFTKMIPMGRPGTVEEAAGAMLFFASPLSDYVSGQVLVVGGGFSM